MALERLLDEAAESSAQAVLISTIVTHGDVHKQHMRRLNQLAEQRGLSRRLLLMAGGTQVSDALARHCSLDAGFGRGATGWEVASVLVRALREREK